MDKCNTALIAVNLHTSVATAVATVVKCLVCFPYGFGFILTVYANGFKFGHNLLPPFLRIVAFFVCLTEYKKCKLSFAPYCHRFYFPFWCNKKSTRVSFPLWTWCVDLFNSFEYISNLVNSFESI